MLPDITVVNLVAVFIVDSANKLWFSHIKEGYVQYRDKINVSEFHKKEEDAPIAEAHRVGEKLKRLLRLAFQRK
eukprot:6510293-Ditylum_brightwellii.AAC.1